MKRIVLSFALLVIAQSGKPSVIEYRLQEPSFAATENAPFQERGRGNGTYTKDSWTVFYRGYEVEGASPSSFEDLGSGYGKDAWKVFYQGLGIEGASPSSFRSFGDGYAKDDWQVFYRGRKIENASSSSFENLGGGDGLHVFGPLFVPPICAAYSSSWNISHFVLSIGLTQKCSYVLVRLGSKRSLWHLNSCELFLIIIYRKIQPAQEIISGSVFIQ